MNLLLRLGDIKVRRPGVTIGAAIGPAEPWKGGETIPRRERSFRAAERIRPGS